MLKLVTTDFDGTLVQSSFGESCGDSLALALGKIKQDGVLWSISTGRTLVKLLEGLKYLNAPVRPDYIMTNERHLYYHEEKRGWQPLGDWNERCDLLHEELFEKSDLFFEQMRKLLSRYPGKVELLENDQGLTEGLVAETEELLDEIIVQWHLLPYRPDHFSFQRSHIYLRFCHENYHKGATLKELNRFLSLKPENVLAIGDHCNDISMLDGTVAAMAACPSNAHPAVKLVVKQAQGHISNYAAGKGTAEAIVRYHQALN